MHICVWYTEFKEGRLGTVQTCYRQTWPAHTGGLMAEAHTQQWVHLNGKLVPKSQASLSIYDHGFLYGDGAFEGIRVYSRNIFRLKQHIDRLFNSAKSLSISLKVDSS